MTAAPPTSPFGRYLLKRRIARGGMGEVFEAEALGADGFRKPVVIKRILRELAGDDDLVELFAAEARLMTELSHPNIVQVIDFGRGDSGDCFLVLELVSGADLGRFAKSYFDVGEQVPLALALLIVTQALRGLHHAHGQRVQGAAEGLVHRDVSPGNILLSRVGEVKVADFGVAMVADQRGTVVGKPRYMAPEQLLGDPLDARADIFAMGVVLYELVTGASAFGELPAAERVSSAIDLGPLEQRGDASRLGPILQKACASSPSDRYASAKEMSRALRDVGARIADPDELADAVVERCPLASGGKVVRLGALGRSAGEVTHVGLTSRTQGFTLHVEDDEAPGESGTERLGSHEVPLVARPNSPGKPARGWLWAGLGMLFGVAAIFGVLRLQGTPAGVAAQPPAPSSSSSRVETSERNEQRGLDASPAPLASSARAAPSAASAPTPVTPPAAVVAKAGPETATCFGTVVIPSTGSWSVSGGPQPVQSPGRYRWPCGSYSLSAVSRLDRAKTRAGSVTVRDGKTSTFDLR